MPVTRYQHPSLPRRVLLVGWDAADWQMIRPLMARGLMPTTARFLERAASGNLATTRPILSPILWNTIATGRRPDAHGILGFTEPVPDGPGVRPVASTSRRCKALWNILTQCGLRSNVVGWYASHPAEPIAGVMVSNQAEAGGADKPMPPGAVHPPHMAEALAACRVHPSELDATAILPFVPQAAQLMQQQDNRLGKLAVLLAQTASVHAMATHLLAQSDWDFTAVYYDGIDRFGHEFMEFHPPKMAAVSQEDFDAYHLCMEGIYRFHDMMLDALLQLAGPETAVVVMSDHGYWNDHRRPDPRPGKAGPVDWHRPYGIFAAAGPGLKAGAQLHGASILDITPTVLTLLGLPAAADMPGRVLGEALVPPLAEVAAGSALERIPSWEAEPGECGMHPPDLRVDPAESRAALEQLVALGYISPLAEDEAKAQADTLASNQLQLAQSYLDAGRPAKALEVVAALDSQHQQAAPTLLFCAACHAALGQLDAATAALDALPEPARSSTNAVVVRARLDLERHQPQEALARLEALKGLDARTGMHALIGQVQAALQLWPEAEASLQAALAEEPEDAAVLGTLAEVLLQRGQAESALEHGLRAAALNMHAPRVHWTIGRAFTALGLHREAVNAYAACAAQAPGWTEAREALQAARAAAGMSG